MGTGAWLAVILFVALFVILVSEWMHRALAAMLAALAAVTLGLLTPVQAVNALDWNTLVLLFGLMLMVALLERAGLFLVLADFARRVAGPYPWRLVLAFMAVTVLVSAFLPNLMALMIIGPALMSSAEGLGLDPIPLLIVTVIASNFGGLSTLIGDPPNILIGTAANLHFGAFFVEVGPIALMLLVVLAVYLRATLHLPRGKATSRTVREPLPTPRHMVVLLAVFALTIVAFLLAPSLGMPIGVIGLGGGLVSVLVVGPDFEDLLKTVDWSTLMFFGGLFVVVGAMVQQGVIQAVAHWLITLQLGPWLAVAILVGSALCSAVLDNIPIVAAAIPLIRSMLATHPQYGTSLWVALAVGAGVGGNATLYGASANVMVSSLAKVRGYTLTFKDYLRWGLPITGITLVAASLWMMVITHV